MTTRALFAFTALATLIPTLMLEGCTSDDDATPPAAFDAATLDGGSSETSTSSDGSTTSDTSTSDAGTDSATDSGADVWQIGTTPCTSAALADAGDGGAGCTFVAVDFCQTEVDADFYAVCGANRTPNRAVTCSDSISDLSSAGGPDGGPYYAHKVQQCPTSACPSNATSVVWRCIECCPN